VQFGVVQLENVALFSADIGSGKIAEWHKNE